MQFDLSGLGEHQFERLAQALAHRVLGVPFRAYGQGPDGGRDGTFSGEVCVDPARGLTWNGYGVVQAKYKSGPIDTPAGTRWLKTQIRGELAAWTDPTRARRSRGQMPEYLIFVSNVNLSAVPGRGGADEIDQLIRSHQTRLGLRDWQVWDHTQLCALLTSYGDIRDAFGLDTPGDVLAVMKRKLLEQQPAPTSVPAAEARLEVGAGIPGAAVAFRDIVDQVGGADVLGHPESEGIEGELGFWQFFRHPTSGARAVVSALYGRAATVVTAEWWNAISTLSAAPGGAGGHSGAGFPVPNPDDPDAGIRPDTTTVDLAGGSWGSGRAVRGLAGEHHWEPQTRFTMEAVTDRQTWPRWRPEHEFVRFRIASRPALHLVDEAIDSAGRRRLTDCLADGPLLHVLTDFAAARGLQARAFTWTRASGDDYRNDREHASYQAAIVLPDGTAALTAELRVQLPSGSYGDTLVLVDVRVRLGILLQPADPSEVAAELRNPIASGGDPRATAGELHRIFSHAWQLAADPSFSAFTPHPDRLQPRAAPKVELHLGIEYAHDKPSNERASLAQVVNFDSFGAPDRAVPAEMSVGVYATLRADDNQRADLCQRAMVYMAEQFGYLVVLC